MADSVPTGSEEDLPNVVDTGEGNTLQYGTTNLMVITDLPKHAEASDIPQVDMVSDSQRQMSSTDIKLAMGSIVLAGKKGKAQVGKENRAVIIRKEGGDEVCQKSPSPRTSPEPTTEAVQVSSALVMGELAVDCSGLPQTNVHGNIPSICAGDQETFTKEVYLNEANGAPISSLTPNIPVSEEPDPVEALQQSALTPHSDLSSSVHYDKDKAVLKKDVATATDKIDVRNQKLQTSDDTDFEHDGEDQEEVVCFQEVRGEYVKQIGPNNTIVDIHINEEFLRKARKGGEVKVTPWHGPIMTLTWKGVEEAVASVRTAWILKFSELMEHIQSDFLDMISHDVFSPLRGKVAYFFKKYNAQLLEICSGSLTFVFLHQDSESAQRMIDDKSSVREMFHRWTLGIGKGALHFSLEVSFYKDPPANVHGQNLNQLDDSHSESIFGDDHFGSIPLDPNNPTQTVYSRMQECVLEDSLKQPSDAERRLQSLECGFLQMKQDITQQISAARANQERDMKEMLQFKELVLELMNKGSQSQTEKNTLLPPYREGLSIEHPKITKDDKEVSYGRVAPKEIANVVSCIKTDLSVSSKLGESLGELSSHKGEWGVETESTATGYPPLHQASSASDVQKRKQNQAPIRNQNKEESRKPSEQALSGSHLHKEFDDAERLLSSLNVASPGRSATSKEVKRLANAVAHALIDDNPPPPRAKSIDTLLCLDVSESIGEDGLKDVKSIAINFVDGIQHIAEQYDLEENIGVIAMGGGAKIVQQLTIDYGSVTDAIESLQSGGTSPIFEALAVCVAAIQGRGGVLSVGGAHKIRPRIIFITDGLATNDAHETGPDSPSTDDNTKIQLIRLVSQFSSKEQSSAPNPIVWVPVGHADRVFLNSLARLGGGMVVDGKDISTLCSYYRIQESVGKIYICVRNHKDDWDNVPEAIEAVADVLVGDLQEEEKREVVKAVQHKLENKEEKNPDSDPNDYEYIHEVKDLPLIGTRVIRGPDWRYDDQDSGGPGTVINHAKDEHLLWVMWDLNSTVCRYRFGLKGKYDVFTVEDQPRILLPDELIEIGVKVKRGPDWSYGDRDGGRGEMGVVIRKRKDGKVKVRWPNGTTKSCRYGYDGKFDLSICSLDELFPTARGEKIGQLLPTQQDPNTERGHEKPTANTPHVLWQWRDDLEQWRLYNPDQIDKMNREFGRRSGGSCLVSRHGRNYRVIFKDMSEKCTDDGTRREVRRKVVSDEERDELVCVEISIDEGSPWAG